MRVVHSTQRLPHNMRGRSPAPRSTDNPFMTAVLLAILFAILFAIVLSCTWYLVWLLYVAPSVSTSNGFLRCSYEAPTKKERVRVTRNIPALQYETGVLTQTTTVYKLYSGIPVILLFF